MLTVNKETRLRDDDAGSVKVRREGVDGWVDGLKKMKVLKMRKDVNG